MESDSHSWLWRVVAEGQPLLPDDCSYLTAMFREMYSTADWLWGWKLVRVAIWNDRDDTVVPLLRALAVRNFADTLNGRCAPMGHYTPLMAAAVYGSSRAAWSLLQAKADVEFTHSGYHRAVVTASCHGHADVVCVLAHAKATLGEVKGAAPLSYAVSSDRADVVSVLLEHKATANFVDMWGATPLCIASTRGNVHIARLLIEGGADVNGVSRVENLPFRRKRRNNGLDEDNATERERSGTSLSCAVARGDDDMVRLLIGLKADVHKSRCRPPARRATTVQLLLDAKARISYTDGAVV
jgi:hypothetical protein